MLQYLDKMGIEISDQELEKNNLDKNWIPKLRLDIESFNNTIHQDDISLCQDWEKHLYQLEIERASVKRKDKEIKDLKT